MCVADAAAHLRKMEETMEKVDKAETEALHNARLVRAVPWADAQVCWNSAGIVIF